MIDIRCGDALDVLRSLPEASVDAVVTDPPYGLSFMGKAWDHGIPGEPFWAEALRVAKPGAHLAAFGGTRTYHRLACAIEDAGWEIRDCLMWLYGSGFPKSLDVSKAIDKAAGAEREVVGVHVRHGGGSSVSGSMSGPLGTDSALPLTAPYTPAARQWSGWGTALKPAYEPVILARKPLDMAGEFAILVPTIERELCKVATFAKTDTPSSEPLRASGFLSIASSFSKCLVDLSEQANRLTTATAFALITDLRILSCSLSRLTRAITIGDWSAISGVASDAWLVGGISRSVLAKCERLTFTTADELAIGLHASEAEDPEGSRLSPDWLPIILARKPLASTVAANVQEHGTGAINVDGCRIEPTGERLGGGAEKWTRHNGGWDRPWMHDAEAQAAKAEAAREAVERASALGRWPANVLLDEDAAAALDAQSGDLTSGLMVAGTQREGIGYRGGLGTRVAHDTHGDRGGASRFFYTAKASASERHAMFDRTPLVVYAEPSWANAVLGPRLLAVTGRSPERVTVESTIRDSDGSAWSMCWCGSLTTDPYHPVTASIIATETSLTTAERIWKRSVRPHTNGCMAAVFGALAHGGSRASCAASSSPWEQRIGTSAGRDGPSTEGADLATLVESWLKSTSAKPGKGGGHRVSDGNTHPT